MYDLPPVLSGSSEKQLAALRSYLVRVASQLNSAQSAPVVMATKNVGKIQTAAAPTEKTAEDIRKNAEQLRALILKTADTLGGDIVQSQEQQRRYTDAAVDALSESCLARSEFGSFIETLETQISTTARGVTESYGYASLIESAQNDIALLQSYRTLLDGEIRRGIVTDPTTNETVTGIAISQNLQFTGVVRRGADGADYYELSSGQTFGLYTSTGWQFWIDGCKRGWYDSVDGMLHIANTAVENSLRIGGEWRIINENGLGIKCTGR